MGLNYAFAVLGGNMVRDVELKTLGSGTVVGSFGIAVNKSYKKDGEKVDKTSFFNCVAWGKTAEFIEQYFKKGDPILVNAEPQMETWDTDEGKRSAIKFIVSNATFVASGAKSEEGGEAAPAKSPKKPKTPKPDVASPAPAAGGDEVIPF